MINDWKAAVEKARESYMGGGAAYSELKKTENELNDYLKEISESAAPKDVISDSTNKPNIEMETSLKKLLEETLTILTRARKLTNIGYIVQSLDKAIDKIDSALELASSINDSGAVEVIQIIRNFLNESRAKYSISNSYDGIVQHKDAIKALEKYLKANK